MNTKELLIDALPMIEKFAPTIASAIGGPFGAAAGYAVSILAHRFGGVIPNLNSTILNDPDANTKLQSLEEEHGDWLDTMMDTVSNLAKAQISITLEWQPTK